MNLRTEFLILSVAACLVCAESASAGRVFVQAHGGWSTLNLDDVNDGLEAGNESLGENLLDPINSGLDAGLKVGYGLTGELNLALGYARLWAESGFSRDGLSVEYDWPADLYELSLDFVPVNKRKVRLGAGATLGMIRSGATLKVTDPLGDDRDDAFKGSGFLFAAYGIAETELSPRWSLTGQAGFRHAVINELKLDDEVVLNPDSVDDKLRFNYSGFFLRLGIKFQI